MDFLSGLFIFIYIMVAVYIVWCFMEITRKAGYTYLFGLWIVVPIGNLIVLGILAFEKWPIRKSIAKQQLRELIAVLATENEQTKLQGESHFKICQKCGYQITDEMIYCPKCGYKSTIIQD